MLREAFILTGGVDGNPQIMKCDITVPQGVSWREAKKQLRGWYLEQAKQLRSITQKDYFGA